MHVPVLAEHFWQGVCKRLNRTNMLISSTMNRTEGQLGRGEYAGYQRLADKTAVVEKENAVNAFTWYDS